MLARMKAHKRLQLDGVPDFMEGREGFVAPEDWVIGD